MGPWNRIQYPGSQIANISDGPADLSDSTGGLPGAKPFSITDYSPTVDDASTLGIALNDSNPLPSATNAVRWSNGYSEVGQQLFVKIRVLLTTAALTSTDGTVLNFTANGSDYLPGGSKDNSWRYFAPVTASSGELSLTKTLLKVDGVDYAGGTVPEASVLTYQVQYLNLGNLPINNVALTDVLSAEIKQTPCNATQPTLANITNGVSVSASAGTADCPDAGATLTFNNLPNVNSDRLDALKGGVFTYDVTLENGLVVGTPIINMVKIVGTDATTSAVVEQTDTVDVAIGLAPTDDYSDASLDGTAAPDGTAGASAYGVASHTVVSGIQLGATITIEANAVEGADNTSDDGVDIPPLLLGVGGFVTVDVSGAGGYLQGWIDWNQDGVFSTALGSSERLLTDIQDGGVGDADLIVNGQIRFTVTPALDAPTGTTYARFRWSTTAGLNSTGPALDGEVEDYPVTVAVETSLTPFSCTNPILYQATGTAGSGDLRGYDPTTNTFSAAGFSAVGFHLNALGYREQDNYLYGFNLTNNPDTIVRVGSDGSFEDLGSISGFTAFANVGDVHPDGTLWVSGSGHSTLAQVDISRVTPTFIRSFDIMPISKSDMAFSADGSKLYFAVNGSADLYEIDMSGATPVYNPVPIGSFSSSGAWGAQWATPTQFFAYDNDTGNLHVMDLSTFATDIIANDDIYAQNDGASCRGELNFYDFGDAPTSATSYGSVSHTIKAGLRLGGAISAEASHFDSANADGDVDDGVTIPALTESRTATITATVSGTNGYLQGWIDWDGNGAFDAGEQVATNLQDNGSGADIAAADGTITFAVTPPIGVTTSQTFARFRWSTTQNLDSTTAANDGEVEDYAVTVQALPPTSYGTPDPTITSYCAVQGAYDAFAFDDDGQAAAYGVTIAASKSSTGPNTSLADLWGAYSADTRIFDESEHTLKTSSIGYNHIWYRTAAKVSGLDDTFTWTFSGENVYDIHLHFNSLDQVAFIFDPALNPNMGWQVVSNNDDGANINSGTVLRFADIIDTDLDESVSDEFLGGDAGKSADGTIRLFSTDGNPISQVIWKLEEDPSRFSSNKNDRLQIGLEICGGSDRSDADTVIYGEATHGFAADLRLGALRDNDFASISNADATGDGSDDDGVIIPTLTEDETADVTIAAADITGTGTGILHAWIDFNGNGDFETQEHTSVGFNNGATGSLIFSDYGSTPSAGTTFARFRLTSDGAVTASTPASAASDGEVEDYLILITPVGVTVSGRVYRDINVNAVNDAGEVGVTQLPVVLYDTVNGTCVSTRTNGNGDYRFEGVATGNYQVYEASRERVPVPQNCGTEFAKDPGGYRSTTLNALAAFDVSSSDVPGKDFGDVKPPVFESSNSNQILPGNVLFYAHRFTTPTQGTVSFTSVSGSNVTAGWASLIYRDSNCNGQLDGTEGSAAMSGTRTGTSTASTWVSGSVGLVAAGSSVCLINKVYAPSNVAANDRYQQTITADFNYANASGVANTIAGTETLTVTDTTTAKQVQAPALPATPVVEAAPAVVVEVPAQPATPNVPATETTPEVPSTPYIPEVAPVPEQLPVAATPVVPELGPSRLELRKTVRNIDVAGSVETESVNTAKPGDTLEYRIYYRNTGTGPLDELIINDVVPPYTELVSGIDCGALVSSMTCDDSPSGLDVNLKWVFGGVLNGGSGSFVSYQVKIDE